MDKLSWDYSQKGMLFYCVFSPSENESNNSKYVLTFMMKTSTTTCSQLILFLLICGLNWNNKNFGNPKVTRDVWSRYKKCTPLSYHGVYCSIKLSSQYPVVGSWNIDRIVCFYDYFVFLLDAVGSRWNMSFHDHYTTAKTHYLRITA